jgi:DNA-binding GntR family transcriptional regulator
MEDVRAGRLGEKAANASEEVAELLREQIMSGELLPGLRITQRDLATKLGISSMPVRDAIKRLLGEGLVVHEGLKTVVVAPLRAEDFIDIMEMRMLLEPAALERSGPRLTQEDLAGSRALLEAAQADDLPSTFVEKHWAFHRSLYHKAGRPRLLASIEALHLHLNRYLMPNWAQVGVGPHWAEGEWELVQLAMEGKWKAARDYLVRDLDRTMLRVLHALPS